MGDNDIYEDIADLKARMMHVENEIEAYKNKQDEQGKMIYESVIEGEKMSAKIDSVKNMVEQLINKRIRFVDLAIALGVATTGIISAYAALQANQLSKVMIELARNIPK